MKKIYNVVHTNNPAEANELTDFVFPWLDREAPKTRFRAWHLDEILYFAFDVEDSDIVLDESESDDDKALGSDRVELFFSPAPDLSEPYYGFEMDPRGLVYDYQGVFHRQFDPAWSLDGFAPKGKFTPKGYRVTGSFSFDDLRALNCLKGKEMITGVYRAEFSYRMDGSVQQDWISWVDPGTENPDFHIPESFGLFVFE